MWDVRGVISAVLLVSLVAGCSTTGGMPRTSVADAGTHAKALKVSQKTATQQAVGKCIASVTFGVIVGGILGQATSRNPAGGAAAGGLIGAGACAVFLQLAAEEDQARMRALEQEAVAANTSQTRSFTTKTGYVAQVQTVVVEAPGKPVVKVAEAKTPAADPEFTTCRYASTKVTIGTQSNEAGRQLWCRVDTGDWQPIDE